MKYYSIGVYGSNILNKIKLMFHNYIPIRWAVTYVKLQRYNNIITECDNWGQPDNELGTTNCSTLKIKTLDNVFDRDIDYFITT